MVLCEILDASNFFVLWAALAGSGAAVIMLMSGVSFYMLYVNPSYELWRWKTNPNYPPADMVREEIAKSLKGALMVTAAPAGTLYLAQHGYSKGYCGIDDKHDWQYTILQFFVLWLVSDFYEFFYHYLGHKIDFLWENHRAHHKFFNPSPMAVIADDFFDQFWRGAPLLVFPMIADVNVDLMFGQWAMIFYLYGTYIHTGYESPYLSAHQPILNTSYHHHLHHAKSTNRKPMHTGFFFKVWDNLFGSTYEGKCFCVRCQHTQGKRTEKEFGQIEIPDYSVLLEPSFWFTPRKKAGM